MCLSMRLSLSLSLASCLLILDDVDSHASWSSVLLKACIDHRVLLDVNGLGEEVRGHVCDQGHGTCSSDLQMS